MYHPLTQSTDPHLKVLKGNLWTCNTKGTCNCCLSLKSLQRDRKIEVHWSPFPLLHMPPYFPVYLQCKQSLGRAPGGTADWARPSLDVLLGDTFLCFPQVAAGLNLQIDPDGQLLERQSCMMEWDRKEYCRGTKLEPNRKPKTVSFIFTFGAAGYTFTWPCNLPWTNRYQRLLFRSVSMTPLLCAGAGNHTCVQSRAKST